MDQYELSEQAQTALEGIVVHTIREFGRKQAVRVAEGVFKAAERLAAMPGTGHRREDVTEEPVLFWTIREFGITLIYDPEAHPLLIVQVVGPGQDVAELL